MHNQNDYQCIGCGAYIQTEDPTKMGYLPTKALEKGLDQGQFYCQRCFRLRHYNEIQDLGLSDDVFLEKLSQIAHDDALVIKVIDLFDVEGSLIHGLTRFIGKQPFVVFANKFDLLPKVTKANRVTHWLKEILAKNALKPQSVILGSAKRLETLTELIDLIEGHIHQRNIYIVGVTNVGKSTLINQLIRHYGGEKEVITTSNLPGTTLDLIQIPVTEATAIIDTPGIIHDNQLAHYLSREELKKVLPTKPLKPKTYQLNSGQTIFLAGLARVDFVAGERTAFTYYVSTDLYLHRTKSQGASEFYHQHLGGLLSPPQLDNNQTYPELVASKIKLKADEDIAISGLGWITCNQSAELVVWVPKGVSLLKRKAII